MRYTPEVILVDEKLRDRLNEHLHAAVEDCSRLIEAEPLVAQLFAENGWTPRMMAWNSLLMALADECEL